MRRFFKSIRRAWAYAKFGWGNYDWDHSFLLGLLQFKLQRMHKYLVREVNTRQEKPALQSLRLASKLAEKLADEQYHYFVTQHDKKWGPAEMEFTPADPDTGLRGSTLKLNRPKVTSKKKEAQERREFKKAVEQDDMIRARDARWLFSIMEKYYQYWWD